MRATLQPAADVQEKPPSDLNLVFPLKHSDSATATPRLYISAAFFACWALFLVFNICIICLHCSQLMAARVFTTVRAIGSFAWKAPQNIFRVIFVPWRSSYEPIKSFLNDESTEEQIGSWRDRKLAELTFVGITVRFIEHLFPAFEAFENTMTDYVVFSTTVRTDYWSRGAGSHLATSTNRFRSSSRPLVQQPDTFACRNLSCNSTKCSSQSCKQLQELRLSHPIHVRP